MLKRLPFILFIATIAALVFMIIVRTSVLGLRVLSMSSGTGKFLAGSYDFSVFLFLVLLAVFAVITISMNVLKKKRRAVSSQARYAEEDVFETLNQHENI